MSPCVQFHHRDPGIIGLMTRYLNDRKEKDEETIFYGLITDTHHTAPNAVRLAYRANKKGNSLIHATVTIMHYS